MNLTQAQFSKVIVKSISCVAIAIENEKKLKNLHKDSLRPVNMS